MGHARQGDLADSPFQVQVHHLAAAVPGGADDAVVLLGQEEVVEIAFDRDAAHREGDFLMGVAGVLTVIVDPAGKPRGWVVLIADLPYLGNILEGGDEARARIGGVDGADPGALAFVIPDLDHLQGREFPGVQCHQRMGQVVGHHDVAPIVGDRQVAGIDAGAYLGDVFEIEGVELAYPAVAGGEIDISAPFGPLGPAVQRKAGGQSVDGDEGVAVQQGGVMIPQFHDHEQVGDVGIEQRLVRQFSRFVIDQLARLDLRHSPGWDLFQGRIDEVHQGLDLLLGQFLSKGGHLRGGPTVPDRLEGGFLAQPLEVLGKQRRSHRAESARAVALAAVLFVDCGDVDGAEADGRQCYSKKDVEQKISQAGSHLYCPDTRANQW